ncbi:MAG: antitoxin family protein [Desulfurococcales archaeon]|nr:antitoxin family protein [Desulfurococcales archaeon]
MSRVIRARYEKGVLKPLEKLELEEGEEVEVVLEEDIIEFARRVRKYVSNREEPSELLSRERDRFVQRG